jgi:hypothetical protein
MMTLREANPEDAAREGGVPVWCLPGSRVGVIGSYAGQTSYAVATVSTVGKRFVVLDNGDRYSKDRLRRRIGDYGWVWDLVDLTSDRWRTEVTAHNRRVRLRLINKQAAGLGAAADLPASVEDLIRVLAPLTPRGDAILAALEPTQKENQ